MFVLGFVLLLLVDDLSGFVKWLINNLDIKNTNNYYCILFDICWLHVSNCSSTIVLTKLPVEMLISWCDTIVADLPRLLRNVKYGQIFGLGYL